MNSGQNGKYMLDLLEQNAQADGLRKVAKAEAETNFEHPSTDRLCVYAEGELEGAEARQIRTHLLDCPACNRKTLYIMRLCIDSQAWFEQVAVQLQSIPARLVAWIGPLWQPDWAGIPAYAADIPEQGHTFMEPGRDGEINITCSWREQFGTSPAYLQIAWLANLSVDRELWALFFEPESKKLLAEIPLGKYLEGGKSITTKALGFNPSREKWAMAILLKERES